MRRLLLTSLGALVIVSLVAFFTSPPTLHARSVLISDSATVLICVSAAAYQVLHRRLGAVTSLAAVSVAWASIAALNASLASSCPGNTGTLTASCTPREVAAQATVALLLPLVPLVFILPLRALLRAYRVMHAGAISVVTKSPSSVPPTNVTSKITTSSRSIKGRTTPKGTPPASVKKKRR